MQPGKNEAELEQKKERAHRKEKIDRQKNSLMPYFKNSFFAHCE